MSEVGYYIRISSISSVIYLFTSIIYQQSKLSLMKRLISSQEFAITLIIN
jgi:hypothetical protein